MGKPDSPAPPDPVKQAQAQTQTNVATAQANAALGNVNQITPTGSLTYEQTGQRFIDDPNGQTYWIGPNGQIQSSRPAGSTGTRSVVAGYNTNPDTGEQVPRYRKVSAGTAPEGWTSKRGYTVPQYTATQKLSEAEQKKLDLGQQAGINLGHLAVEQSGKLRDLMGSPVSLDNEATEARLFELGRKRLDPMMSEREEALRTRLANQGIAIGSEAYDREMRNFSQGQNDAYNSLLLGGRGQAVQEALAQRNQPINEITALMSGSQVSQPNFVNVNQGGGGIPTTDMAGLQQAGFQNRFGAYNSQLNSYNQTMGGLMSAAGAVAAAAISDKRAKENIEKVGKVKGQNVYTYNYKGSPQTQIGFMAQEVERVKPEAVLSVGGLKMVDYKKALA